MIPLNRSTRIVYFHFRLEIAVEPWIEGLWAPLKEEVERLQDLESNNCDIGASHVMQNGSVNGDIILTRTDSDNVVKGSDSDKVSDINNKPKNSGLKPGVATDSADFTEEKGSDTSHTKGNDSTTVSLRALENGPDQVDSKPKLELTSNTSSTSQTTAKQNKSTENVDGESLTTSVPPLSESALNLPTLPPAYTKMSFHSEESVVSTSKKHCKCY